VTLKAQDSVHSATATGNGPVNALDLCLRQCLSTLYPAIADVKLTDYKGPRARFQEGHRGPRARAGRMVRSRRSWATVGVSDNVIEASWFALVDAMRLELMRLNEQDPNIERAVEDYCWGVQKFRAGQAVTVPVTRVAREYGMCMEMTGADVLKAYDTDPYHKVWTEAYAKVRVDGTTTYNILGQ
jgi:hypothetical protein